MNIEPTILTALVTLIVLAAVSVFLVVQYKRSHAAATRDALIDQAHVYGISVPQDLSNHELIQKIRAAKREQKHRTAKTA